MKPKHNCLFIVIACACCLFSIGCEPTQTQNGVPGAEHSSGTFQKLPKPGAASIQKPENGELPSSSPRKEKVVQLSIDFPKQLFPNIGEITPSNGSFSEEAFEQAKKIEGTTLPLYRVEVDTSALTKALDRLQSIYGSFKRVERRMYTSGPDKVKVYAKDNKVIKVNYSSGSLSFVDLGTFQKADGVKELDIALLQSRSEAIFKEFLGDRLDSAYLYRFRKYRSAHSDGTTVVDDGIYEVAFALNQTLDGLPIIGSGGKYSIHLQPNGTLAKADFHFVNFKKVPNSDVELFDSRHADQKLWSELGSFEITENDHVVKGVEFGYFLPTAKGRIENLVPAFGYFVEPKPGVVDQKRIFTYPASEDPSVLDAVKADRLREDKRKMLRVQVDDLPEDVVVKDPISVEPPEQ